jgi:hypothetical protein
MDCNHASLVHNRTVVQSISQGYIHWHTQNTQINQGKLNSTGQYPLLSDLSGTPEEGSSKEGNAQEEYCWQYWAIGKEEAQDNKPTKTPEEERVDMKDKDVKDGQGGKA